MAQVTADSAEQSQGKYKTVDLTTLRVGMLVDRPLYMFLPSQNKYVCMIRELHPLEERTLEKFKRLGNVYSSLGTLGERFPKLRRSAVIVNELCESTDVPSFDKNRRIRRATRWLVPHLFDQNSLATVLFFYRTFRIPVSETLFYVADLSIENYEKSVRLSTTAGLIALWLGYSNASFIRQFVETAFCEAIAAQGLSSEGGSFLLSDEQRRKALQLIESKKVPGVPMLDQRFKSLLASQNTCKALGDELVEVLEFSRWVCGQEQMNFQRVEQMRIARKLIGQFGGLFKRGLSARGTKLREVVDGPVPKAKVAA
ncbi:MAG: hypothetical protein AB1540_11200 [Bdellovibrionota bacterium]